MKSVVVCGDLTVTGSEYSAVDTIDIEGLPITVGHSDTQELIFERNAPENQSSVLLKINSFSCNYRDKSFILAFHKKYHEASVYTPIGSEFAAEVVAAGPLVTGLRVGDRVMGNNHYGKDGIPGIPSNSASRRYRILSETKLITIPPEMSNEVAATFSIGAQTSYSMVRKLHLQPDSPVLLTAATSNTSLFLLQALQHAGGIVYATTTSDRHREDLQRMGAHEVIVVDPTVSSFCQYPAIDAVVQKKKGFSAVVDPFNDLYLHKAIEILGMDGIYITCGFADQYSSITGKSIYSENRSVKQLMDSAFFKNVSIVSNCLGNTEDLRRAIADYQADKLSVPIDSVFHGNQVAAFFERTYTAPDRFGKVVYSYDD